MGFDADNFRKWAKGELDEACKADPTSDECKKKKLGVATHREMDSKFIEGAIQWANDNNFTGEPEELAAQYTKVKMKEKMISMGITLEDEDTKAAKSKVKEGKDMMEAIYRKCTGVSGRIYRNQYKLKNPNQHKMRQRECDNAIRMHKKRGGRKSLKRTKRRGGRKSLKRTKRIGGRKSLKRTKRIGGRKSLKRTKIRGGRKSLKRTKRRGGRV